MKCSETNVFCVDRDILKGSLHLQLESALLRGKSRCRDQLGTSPRRMLWLEKKAAEC